MYEYLRAIYSNISTPASLILARICNKNQPLSGGYNIH